MSISYKSIIFFFLDVNLNISRNTVVLACISFPGYIDNHSFSNSSRNFHLYNFFTSHNSGSMALFAFIFYNHSFSIASRTFSLCLHHPEHGSHGFGYKSLSMTSWAGFRTTSRFCTTAVTMWASYIFFYFKLLCCSICYFLKC